MPALTYTERHYITLARIVADADGPNGCRAALAACESELADETDPGNLRAALLGRAQSMLTYLASVAERLAAELDKAEAEPEPPWSVWHVDIETGRGTEIQRAPRGHAEQRAASLNYGAPQGTRYVALPPGGLPSDESPPDNSCQVCGSLPVTIHEGNSTRYGPACGHASHPAEPAATPDYPCGVPPS